MKWQAVARSVIPGRKGVFVTFVVMLVVAMTAAATGDGPGRSDDRDTGGPGSSGPAENKKEGEIYLVTPEVSRGFTVQSMDRISHYRINVVGEAPFELRAQRTPASVCLAGNCQQMPDFDIAFFREKGDSSASVIERHYGLGLEEGKVPPNADFAHVYLRTSGYTPDNLRGYAFVYLQGNPGGQVLPDWP